MSHNLPIPTQHDQVEDEGLSASDENNTNQDHLDSSSDDDIDEMTYSIYCVLNYISSNSSINNNNYFSPIYAEHTVYGDIGDPVWEYPKCGALMWYQDRKSKSRNTSVPKFQLCCRAGKVQLPLLDQPPSLLQNFLFQNATKASKNFQSNIRTYNAMFSFTYPGMQLDTITNKGRGPPTIRLQGQVCNRIGSMLPLQGQRPKFAQLYIYETDNEISNRMESFR